MTSREVIAIAWILCGVAGWIIVMVRSGPGHVIVDTVGLLYCAVTGPFALAGALWR